jgi:transposase-like protein
MAKQTKFTPEQKKAYIEGESAHCPLCKSDDIEGDHMEVDSTGAWQEVKCNACGATWQDVYKLIDIIPTKNGRIIV